VEIEILVNEPQSSVSAACTHMTNLASMLLDTCTGIHPQSRIQPQSHIWIFCVMCVCV